MNPELWMISNDTSMAYPWGKGDFVVVFGSPVPEPLVMVCTELEHGIDGETKTFRMSLEPVNDEREGGDDE